MENYFKAYKQRFPHKGVEAAISATRNYIEGYQRKMYERPISRAIMEQIERKLNELRLTDC